MSIDVLPTTRKPRERVTDSSLVTKLASLSEGGVAVLKVDPAVLPHTLDQLTWSGHYHREGHGIRQGLCEVDSGGLGRLAVTITSVGRDRHTLYHEQPFPTLANCEDFIISTVHGVNRYSGQDCLVVILPGAQHRGELPARLRDIAHDGIGIALVEFDKGADWKLTVKR